MYKNNVLRYKLVSHSYNHPFSMIMYIAYNHHIVENVLSSLGNYSFSDDFRNMFEVEYPYGVETIEILENTNSIYL